MDYLRTKCDDCSFTRFKDMKEYQEFGVVRVTQDH